MPNTLGTYYSKYDDIHMATEVYTTRIKRVPGTCHGMPHFTWIFNHTENDRPRSLSQEDDAKKERVLLLLLLRQRLLLPLLLMLTCFSRPAARA